MYSLLLFYYWKDPTEPPKFRNISWREMFRTVKASHVLFVIMKRTNSIQTRHYPIITRTYAKLIQKKNYVKNKLNTALFDMLACCQQKLKNGNIPPKDK